MAAEVNMRECLPHKNIVKRQVKKDNMILERTSNDYTDKGKPVAGEMEPTMGTSVLQSKVKALKQKHKDLRISEFPKGKDPLEDTLNVPQLRTYLTEDTLNYTEHGKLPCVNQESWGTENVYGSSSSLRTMWDVSNECEKLCDFTELLNYSQNKAESNAQKWPQDHLREFPHELLGSSHTEDDLSFKSSSMSLAERVERNRQELRWKFNGSPCFGGETSQESNHGHTSRQDSWLVPGADADCDSGVSLPDPEGNRELSIRHEQAKQLLHRARMKAKGASPLRASHCVLPHALSQLPQQRGPCVSGAVTDGGSLSDSSGSDHCSWHRSSRGSSPSHVRFQDESERDVEERYRERQQQGPPSAGISPTTPPARRSNGHVSWTQHLVPFGNENQCGTCGSYIKGSGVQRQNLEAYSAGSNLWNVHLGSRISQDGSINSPLGTKPSPHWILPSQPWRVHSELIRETHIGGDSTADSSGEDEVNRAQKKSCRTLGPLRSSKNKQHNVEPGSGARTSLPQSEIKSSTSALMIDPRTKISESNPETETAVLGNLHNTNIKLEKQVAVHYTEPRTTLNPTNAPLKFGNECLDASPNPGALTIHGHVPVPPAGKAPSAGTPRSGRFAVRSEGAFHHLPVGTSHGENMEQVIVIEKGIPSDTVPKNKNQEKLRVSDIHPLSLSEIKMKEEGRERTQKVKKLIKKEKPNERQEQRNLEGPDVTNGQAESERAHKSLRQRYSDRKNASKEQRNTEVTQTSGDHADRAVSDLLNHHLVKEINNGKREHINAQRSFTGGDVQHESTDSVDVSASEVGSAFCGATLEHPVHDRQLDQESGDVNQCVTHKSSMQPAAKRGDIRSGMKKILSSFGLASRPKLERFQSSSLEQIFTPAAGSSGACVGGNKERCEDAGKDGRLKKSPSLQSLKLVTQFHLPRKASSVQNLLGKSERSAVYLTEDANTAPRRALSVEDIGSPGMPRVLGRVAEVYPDGTRLLQLQRPPQGSFGFSISSVNGRPDSGIYVQEMSDASTAKLFSSLLRVGDEILELNGTKVSTIAHEQLSKIMDRESTLSLRVLHQRRTKC